MPDQTLPRSDPAQAERRPPRDAVARFQSPSPGRSIGQLAGNAVAYVALLGLMYASVTVSFWLTLALAIPTAGFVVRLFIIQHDCGHASYFRSRWANAVTGWLCSLATYTPYASWRRQHAGHHAVWNNLDQRHAGADIYSSCLTLREYQAMTPRGRWRYRLARHPVVAQLLLPPIVFLVLYRLPFDMPRSWRKERRSVQATNLALGAMLAVLALTLGLGPVLLVQLPIMVLASIIGVWLFTVQHRFEESQWARQAEWTHAGASMHGSSCLRLPRLLQWFTGNIGFHHVHHLLPRVPNYHLEACHDAMPTLAESVTTLTLREALRAPSYALWDEEHGRMVRFPELAPSPSP